MVLTDTIEKIIGYYGGINLLKPPEDLFWNILHRGPSCEDIEATLRKQNKKIPLNILTETVFELYEDYSSKHPNGAYCAEYGRELINKFGGDYRNMLNFDGSRVHSPIAFLTNQGVFVADITFDQFQHMSGQENRAKGPVIMPLKEYVNMVKCVDLTLKY